MTDKKISDLGDGSPVDGAEYAPFVKSGLNIKVTINRIKTFIMTAVNALFSDHVAASDPHTQYALESTIGAVNGICPLNESGLVPSDRLPSYVDDVLEFPDIASFPLVGESGKIYIDTSDNAQYRWTGSIYVEIAQTPDVIGIGSTAFARYDIDQSLSTAQQLRLRRNTGIQRGTSSVTTPALSAQSAATGTINIARAFGLLTIQTDYPARVRLYDSIAHRNNDLNRAVAVYPADDSGCLFEFITAPSLLNATIGRPVNGFSADPDSIAIPYTITNLDNSSRAITVTLGYLPTE